MESATLSEHRRRIARVLALLESQLDAGLDVPALARAAAYSEFHFHRIFRAITGETAGGYLRRLLLERAARELRQGEHKILEVALRAGFDSHEAFTRAFAAHFGVPPSQYRSAHQRRDWPEPGPQAAFARVEARPALSLLALRHVGPYAEVGRSWQQLFARCGQAGIQPQQPLGLCWDDPEITPAEAFRYDACVLAPHSEAQPAGLALRELAARSFAVTVHAGSYAELGTTYARLMRWALDRDLPLSTQPTVERYLVGPGGAAAQSDYRTEVSWPIDPEPKSSW